jgi:hypothetical protein
VFLALCTQLPKTYVIGLVCPRSPWTDNSWITPVKGFRILLIKVIRTRLAPTDK